MRSLAPVASFLALGALSLTLGGCPIWADDTNSTGCFGDCCDGSCNNPDACSTQADCGLNEVCGSDNTCHIGDCTSWGCPTGAVCLTNVDGQSLCVDSTNNGGGSSVGGGSAGGASGTGGSGGATPDPTYCGNPDDCGTNEYCAPDGTCHSGDCTQDGCIFGFLCDSSSGTSVCTPESPFACGSDADCSGQGFLCVSGVCTAPSDQCFDQTQCPGGDVCADGKCVPSCANGETCPSDFSCSVDVGLCTTPVTSCSITNDCGSADVVCVDGACVPRSPDGTCPSGSVWVENGCIPDQSGIFVCAIEGMQDACAAGSICLHHSCYISCAAPADQACVALPDFNLCKSVTTTTGSYPVCGSDANLGNECDPTASLSCSPGLICIDGFCK